MADRFAGGNRYSGLDTPVKYGAWLRARGLKLLSACMMARTSAAGTL